ncbi:nucleotide-diphospho-sugar transferase [Neocallimastix californiae]|uniref:Nucleotide-diphospho-sugar transferase n=1 Tax=Neocallimastix californiae TaxID=1754190 RepID=A0A1Y2AF99_9FUNG|nr:nucleotide-diphospho-sugar transferase [Neocallimastix californiae]|eukprot:ORY21241.1 nucleotide-diphospho-sugar transferase [Neocallimastix californiae]
MQKTYYILIFLILLIFRIRAKDEYKSLRKKYSINKNKKDIAIVYICLGKYDVLWKEFYESMKEKFITSMTKDYYIFTDSKNIYKKEEDNVHIIEQKDLGWPGNTLYRFNMFLSQKEELLKFKYIFFFNANVICKQEVGEEFLPKNERLLFVQHGNFYNESNLIFTYERNVNSTAYIPFGKGKHYVQGSINGGKANDFLQMCEVLKNRIAEDDKNNIVAIWHDESHLNRYFLDLDPSQYRLLNISYNYPCWKNIPEFEPKIFLRDKNKYFDVSKIKNNLININKIKRKSSKYQKFLLLCKKKCQNNNRKLKKYCKKCFLDMSN